ncbi:DNA polymerase eta isoform X1 [Diabrotica virgifera virgifera]|uniref:DNA polymerase eta n=2 Tax=Diabrotica virgifera virgifera TaxID=50390 RepID=A0ABM5IZ45_DIAVI|nr:DNA polymerase eta isoform X1 [Diabrotica virgifera virgifera]
MSHLSRVVILLDMDCFYCQVEEKLNPALEGKPIAVVQYNQWRGGGIIAVNYPARDRGVTRHMRGQEAQKKCPEIILAKVPQVRGKADISKYRDAGKRVADVLQTFEALLERASVDEAYLDVTESVLKKIQNGIDDLTIDKLKNTFVVGCDTKDFLHNLQNSTEFSESNLKLCLGGVIAEEIRAEVLKQTGYKCSAGIAHNKILAKLACGLHKPNKQTILPHDAVPDYFKTVPINKLTGLGGKFGDEVINELGISKMAELASFSEKQLVDKFGMKSGSWLYSLARGIDMEPVVSKLISKSIGCCKRFPGRTSLVTHSAIQHWTNELATEISERLEKDQEENNRKAKQMIVSFAQEVNKRDVSSSRTHPLKSYEQSRIAQDSLEVIKKHCQRPDGSYNVTFLGVSVSNFQDMKKSGLDITSFFKKSTNTSIAPVKMEEKSPNNQTNENSSEIPLPETDVDSITDFNEDVENVSIYSASTEDLEEDPKSYIYFEDIYPEFVSSQPLANYCEQNNVPTEVSEVVDQTKELEESRMKSSKSFFSKYFESPSKEETVDREKLNISNESMDYCCDSVSRKNQNIIEESIEILEQSTATQPNTISVEYQQNQSLKRKSSELTISEYFGKSEEPDENYCIECKKNIPLKDFLDHGDYHVAKRLQEELNKPSSTNNTSAKNSIIKVKGKKPVNGNITKFFKRL